ncbi:MAG TPA: LptE family protein [Prolixibacteraceae bacterium]|nr:LptE family protein [Prolixibacteraceae bacterium]
MKRRSSLLILLSAILSIAVFTACKVSYSFTGASIAPNVKTFMVDYFPNRARLVNPNLSQLFTEGLQDKLIKQTSLNQITEGADLEFSGQLTGYDIKPMNISEGDMAAQNRLTISVKVKYTNNKDHEQDWEKSFSEYEDFDSNSSLSTVEGNLVPLIVVKLADDIFNASIANW